MGSSASSAKTSQVTQLVNDFITSNQVAIFSKTYCPYCITAKKEITKIAPLAGILELDNHEQGSAIQAYLQQLTGQRTVPNVFVKGAHVGGCDDTLAAIKSGAFQKAISSDDNIFRQVKL
jgi:glutaredoxin 3